MGYLSEDRLDEIADAVRILPISSDEISDIKQYDLDCGEASEYEMFLKEKAMEFDKLCVSKTFLMIHRETQELIGYFSLATDTIKLTTEEKDDADIEYNEETPEFYLKNGFVYNLSKKRRPSDRTISMRKDIFID